MTKWEQYLKYLPFALFLTLIFLTKTVSLFKNGLLLSINTDNLLKSCKDRWK